MANVHYVRKVFCFEWKKYAFQNWIICKCIEKWGEHSSCKNDSKARFFPCLFHFCGWLDCWIMQQRPNTNSTLGSCDERASMTMSCISKSKVQFNSIDKYAEISSCEIESSDKNVWQPYFNALLLLLDPPNSNGWLMMNIWLIDSILIWSSWLVIRLLNGSIKMLHNWSARSAYRLTSNECGFLIVIHSQCVCECVWLCSGSLSSQHLFCLIVLRAASYTEWKEKNTLGK